MLTGEVEHQLDDRGRVAVPKGFRQSLEHGGFVTRGWYGCLFLFPYDQWLKIREKLSQVSLTNMNGDIVKAFFSGGSDIWLDGQGRISLPAALREWAGIDGEVVVRGAINRIELWGKDRWQAFQSQHFTPENIMAKAAELNIDI
jgi:MraZ protein